jgi:hypothetical protein
VVVPIGRDPIEHELKTWPDFFKAIWDNEKHFELRKDDRGYQAGDTLLLREWSKRSGYSGRALRVGVPYLLGGQWPGLQDGYVIMSIERMHQFVKYRQE